MKRVLVAEDDEAIRRMQARILEAAGYKVIPVGDGKTALDALQADESRPDLALVDIMMPGLTGLELSRAMQADERLKTIPVVFVTAKTDAESMNQGFKAGGAMYLAKPFTSAKLLSVVRAALHEV